ncbi:MAG TPA: hypothetical protein VG847_09265 [Chitinophagaceae bacterium]|nr:hypothetical protein [Chitinophagaceae bacterium]
MKIFPGLFLLSTASLCLSLQCSAQNTTENKASKFTPLVVKTYLGRNSTGDSITSKEADTLITFPLRVIDKKNNSYTIASYGFIYKRKGYVQDENTGLYNVTFTTVADRFKSTPLPKIWIDNMKGNFQPGEELHFFDIIAKDKSNHLFFAPDLVITLK